MRANATEEIFSGSIVADTLNTSGLGQPGHTPLIALYTSVYKAAGHAPGVQAQSLAYSLDQGATWQPYAHNPVLTLDPESKQFRDPKVSWYGPGGYWLMTTVVADAHVVKLYRSDDLIHWNFLSDFTRPGVPHDGALGNARPRAAAARRRPARIRWVMIVNVNPWSIAGGSGAMYFVGDFDGRTFVPDRIAPAGSDPAQFRWVDHGADFYAAGTRRARLTAGRDRVDEQLGLRGESADHAVARRDDPAARTVAENDRRRTDARRRTGRRVRRLGGRQARRA